VFKDRSRLTRGSLAIIFSLPPILNYSRAASSGRRAALEECSGASLLSRQRAPAASDLRYDVAYRSQSE
jgi:hypothetical protein